MKKSILYLLTTMVLLGGCSNSRDSSPLSSSTTNSVSSSTVPSTTTSSSIITSTGNKDYKEDIILDADPVVNEELKACFDFFYETAVTNNSPAYGLIPDRYNIKTNKNTATGFRGGFLL